MAYHVPIECRRSTVCSNFEKGDDPGFDGCSRTSKVPVAAGFPRAEPNSYLNVASAWADRRAATLGRYGRTTLRALQC